MTQHAILTVAFADFAPRFVATPGSTLPPRVEGATTLPSSADVYGFRRSVAVS